MNDPREFYCDVIRINYEDPSNPYVDLRCFNNIDQLKSDNLHYFVNLYAFRKLKVQADKLAEALETALGSSCCRDCSDYGNGCGGNCGFAVQVLKDYRGENG